MNVADLAEETRIKLIWENIKKKGWNNAKLVLSHFDSIPMFVHQDPNHFLMYMLLDTCPWERFEDPIAYWLFKDGVLHCLRKPRPENADDSTPDASPSIPSLLPVSMPP